MVVPFVHFKDNILILNLRYADVTFIFTIKIECHPKCETSWCIDNTEEGCIQCGDPSQWRVLGSTHES